MFAGKKWHAVKQIFTDYLVILNSFLRTFHNFNKAHVNFSKKKKIAYQTILNSLHNSQPSVIKKRLNQHKNEMHIHDPKM